MAKRKKALPFSDQIREAVRNSGRSGNAICKDAKVDNGNFVKWMAGERWLSEATLNRIADVIGIEVTVKPQSKKGN